MWRRWRQPRRVAGRPSAPLWLVGGVVLAVAVASFSRVPLLPDIGRDLNLDAGDLGLMTTAFALGRLAMDLPAGRIADRLSPARGLIGSGAGVAASAALLATAQSFAQAIAAMLLIGVASALTNTTGMTVFATRAPKARRGKAMAGFSTALMTGQTLGPTVGGLLAALGGWRVAQGGAALIGVGVVVPCLALPAAAAAGRRAPVSRGEGASAGLTRAQSATLGAVPFAVFFTLGALTQTLVPLIGAAELDLSASAIGLALGLGGMARFAGTLATGVASDRFSRRAALLPNLGGMAIGVLLLVPSPTFAGWLGAIVLLGVASSGISVAATIVADLVPPATVGRRLANFRFAGDAGLLAGPALAALIYQHAGRAIAMVMTAAVLLACAGAAIVALPGSRATAAAAPEVVEE